MATRFPPEPNGYLHIGHAKSICLNFGVARDFGGTCNLRFDDTNPVTEDVEYVDSIKEDVRWLGFDWEDRVFYASDYFETLYESAITLIEEGLAYVDSLTADQIREYRGSLTEPGAESPHRSRSIEENLDLFRRMRAGEFPDGAHVLRAKIDMASPNLNMRDPVLYRIRRAHHHRTGDAWCIYPMYDYAHPISDAIERITHSICTLEFEDHRPLYDWLIENLPLPGRPQQIEFARLNLTYTVMSKRKLLQLVTEKRVSGWDDPRMPTLVRAATPRLPAGRDPRVLRRDRRRQARERDRRRPARILRARGPEQARAPRHGRPASAQGGDRELSGRPGRRNGRRSTTRRIRPPARERCRSRRCSTSSRTTFSRIRRRSSSGSRRAVRSVCATRICVTCQRAIKDDAGRVVELRCTYDPATRGGDAPDGRKVKATLHWVSAAHAATRRCGCTIGCSRWRCPAPATPTF